MQFSASSLLATVLVLAASFASAKTCLTASASGICLASGDGGHWFCNHAKECPAGYTAGTANDQDNIDVCEAILANPTKPTGLCVARWDCCK